MSIFFLMLVLVAACSLAPDESFQASKAPPTEFTNTPSNPANDWWRPEPGLTWQWQLGDAPINKILPVNVYDIDLDTSLAQVAALRDKGIKVICYISVGSWEEWRADAALFPQQLLGKEYAGWSGEKWLDIRRLDLLAPLLRSRFDLCQEKGFDAIEPDNMDIYANNTGFDITPEDQLQFALWLSQEAHARGLAIGLKNAPDQAADLVAAFDFAITEDCFDQGWCDQLLPFIAAGKPVFAAEYTDTNVDFDAACPWGKANRYSFILKNRELDEWLTPCP